MNTKDRHSKIANIPRPSSVYGHELRSLFGCGKNFIQIGADFASLEARIQAHYVYNYKEGPELAEALVAEKPNDLHAFPVTNQLLTQDGWKDIQHLNKETDLVAQWNKDSNTVEFVRPSSIIIRDNNNQDLMYEFTGSFNFKMTTTNKHRILLFNPTTNQYVDVLAKDLDVKKYSDYVIPLTPDFERNESLVDIFTYNNVPVSSLVIKTYSSTELVGCVSVPSTYLLVKEANSIFISGNCLSEDTEILTKKGWKLFSDISLDTMVAQWSKDTQSITYTFPSEIICNDEYKGDMISVEGDRLSILMTPSHRNVVLNSEGNYVDVLASDLTTEDGIIPTHGLLFGNNIYYEHSAPGLYEKFVNFAKLNTNIYSKAHKTKSGMVLQSESKEIIEEIQTNLLWCNITALIVEKQIYKKAKDTNKITIYQTLIPAKNPNLKGAHLKHTEIKTQHYEGKIYCVRVSTSYIVCRRNGKIFVTGNSINARKLDISRDSAKSFSYA